MPGNVAGFDVTLTQWGLEHPLAALNKLRAMAGAEASAPADMSLVFADGPSRIDLSALGLTNRALRDQLGAALAASFDSSTATTAPEASRPKSERLTSDLIHAAAAGLTICRPARAFASASTRSRTACWRARRSSDPIVGDAQGLGAFDASNSTAR